MIQKKNIFKIPKIIHQIWDDTVKPLPYQFKILSKTWKYHYPDWQYEFWDNMRMNKFVTNYYPEFLEMYNNFPYNIQRCDAIRYLILKKHGGMYVDFDYESIRPLDELIYDKTCCFSQEPISHYKNKGDKSFSFNNALMLATPDHLFINRIIEKVFSEGNVNKRAIHKTDTVFETTGPFIITKLYNMLTPKEVSLIYLIPPEYVSPFDMVQSYWVRNNKINVFLEERLVNSYAVHYFLGTWVPERNELDELK
jgi:Mannosyltransferase OCH1 and related enzymes